MGTCPLPASFARVPSPQAGGGDRQRQTCTPFSTTHFFPGGAGRPRPAAVVVWRAGATGGGGGGGDFTTGGGARRPVHDRRRWWWRRRPVDHHWRGRSADGYPRAAAGGGGRLTTGGGGGVPGDNGGGGGGRPVHDGGGGPEVGSRAPGERPQRPTVSGSHRPEPALGRLPASGRRPACTLGRRQSGRPLA